jgi:hypothetical protein
MLGNAAPRELRVQRLRTVLLVALMLQIGNRPARADSLAQLFDSVLRFEGVLEQSPRFRQKLEAIILSFQMSAVRTADFVATATTPGFAYTFDPEKGSFTRAEIARGPVYVEPADTIPGGGFGVGLAYQYSNFTELNGASLEHALDQLREVRGTDYLDVRTRTFTFRSQLLSLSGTYGITDRWNVNLLLPIFVTTLKLNGTSALLVPGAGAFVNTFVENDTKPGVGDILLRTKYRLPDRYGFQLAAEFTLRLPSGNPDNFQGLGDVTLTPLLVVQRTFGPHVVQANLGIEVDAGSVSQTRARYALGATFRLLHPLTFQVHVVGNSGFTSDHFTEGGVSGVVPRTDIVDAVTGFEYAFTEQLFAYVGAIVPLNDDGLRAAVVPTAWLGARF